MHTTTGHLLLGWLVVEDLASVLVLVALPWLRGSTWTEMGWQALTSVAGLVLLAVTAATIGRAWLPKLLTLISHTRSRELFTLGVLVAALGIATITSAFFGASMALGAFIAGIILGQSELGSRAGADALPMRDAFAVLFFVAVGMQLDPAFLVANPGPTLLLTAVAFLGKPLFAWLALALVGRRGRAALEVAWPLSQIGELSFVIVGSAATLGLVQSEVAQAVTGAALLTITLNSLVAKIPSTWLSGPVDKEARQLPRENHVIIVGYGPVGRALRRQLVDLGIETCVIDLNPDTVGVLRGEAAAVVCGDANLAPILEQAGVRHAAMLLHAASGIPPIEMVRIAREQNPTIRIVARARFASDAAQTRSAGADYVVAEEREVALAMMELLLTQLGATPEQHDLARDRVRRDVQALPVDDSPQSGQDF